MTLSNRRKMLCDFVHSSLNRNRALNLLLFLLPLFAGFPLAAAEESTLSSSASNKTSTVVIVHDASAVDAFRPRPDKVRAMVNCGITNLTGTATPRDAWRTIVSTQDIVGIKVF